MEFKFIDKNEYLKRISEFQKLFRNCFNREIPEKFLKWRYIDNPMEDILVNTALENNNIIANYSVSPCKICINGNIEKAALSMTTMTHPNFRGRGLFPKLAKGLYERMEENSYKAVIGFPNNNSHLIFVNKLSWRDIYEIPTMKLNLLNISNLNNYKNFNIINDKKFLLDYSRLINNSDNKIKIYKDLDYLKWRFRDNPINRYNNYVIVQGQTVVSSIITKKFNNCEIDIVQINSLDDCYTKEILEWVIEKGKNDNFKYANMWCQLNDNAHEIAERIGFVNCEPISYFGVRDFKEKSTDLSVYNNWNIQMGDSDVY